MPGWAYCVEEESYQKHLDGYKDQPEVQNHLITIFKLTLIWLKMNTCHSEHDAIVRAATRTTPGYDVTGAGVVMCSRHGLIQPNGVGDLQKGERYVYSVTIYLAFPNKMLTAMQIWTILCSLRLSLQHRYVVW